MSELVHYQAEGGVAVLTLTNPPANAYSYEMMQELDRHILKARLDEAVHALVLTGAGERFFCAGADIEMLQRERLHEAEGFRHVAPGQESAPPPAGPARGHDRWVINKLRALNSWFTKGLDNGSHLRIAVNRADSIAQLKDVISEFFTPASVR